ncbi:hypothetical protein D3C80_1665720 [compost metagenome]
MPADAAGNAQRLLLWRGIAVAVLAGKFEGALHATDAQHRLAAVGADQLHAFRAALADLEQAALAVDIDHRCPGKQADHPHLRSRQGRRRERGKSQGQQRTQHFLLLGEFHLRTATIQRPRPAVSDAPITAASWPSPRPVPA